MALAIIGLLTALVPLALELVQYIITKSNASEATKQAFYALVAAAYQDKIISVEAHDEFMRQKDQINKP